MLRLEDCEPFRLEGSSETQDQPPALPALPPGSICETCWDQPATNLLPAPWGGEMGVCVWCAKGEGEEASDDAEPSAGVTMDEVRMIEQALCVAARQENEAPMIAAHEVLATRTGVSLGDAQAGFRRLADAPRTFQDVNLDGLVIHPLR